MPTQAAAVASAGSGSIFANTFSCVRSKAVGIPEYVYGGVHRTAELSTSANLTRTEEAVKAHDDATRAMVKDDPSRPETVRYNIPQSPEELGLDVPIEATGLKGVYSRTSRRFHTQIWANVSP